ncbi:MAG TPA: asparagine synthase (glutamine-hydrolyzing) [bacterium]|nr:asparagine synthase (glutamine-hydrolyzing) [bacterium]HQL63306.1 asparagine synthase (glutamine-hydrolyzing) [bacterium]
MCGICGIHWFDGERAVERDLLGRMTRILEHRGPDDEGIHIEPALGLGHRRLSIIGVDDGHQPMSTEDGDLWVVYNGELYNHPEIRRELEGRGFRYRTSSDTESFLHLYRAYGSDFLEKTRGMFALALWDRRNRRLILARDRVGIKPLYYSYQPGVGIRFASEIKSILSDPAVPKRIDLEALDLYMAFLGTPAPWTLLESVRKLHPGEMLIAERGNIQLRRYWTPWETLECRDIPDKEAMELVRESVKDSVRAHLLADVPVGAFLSGGIDSSVVVAVMAELCGPGFPTFSIGFEGAAGFDETSDARLVANHFQTEHHEQRLTHQNLLEWLPEIMWAFDEPLADASALPTYAVSRLAHERLKVILSGDGADEIFAGYRKYTGEYYRRYVEWIPGPVLKIFNTAIQRILPESRSGTVLDKFRQFKKFLRGLDPDPVERHAGWAIHFEDDLRRSIYSGDVRAFIKNSAARDLIRGIYGDIRSADPVNRMLWTDCRQCLPDDMLVKTDRMSMLSSLEVRVPFLDHQLIEQVFSLPGHLKLRGGTTKWVLKQAFADLLPAAILQKPKHGFDVPVGQWFRKELRDVIEDICSEKSVANRGLFDPKTIRRLVEDHQAGRREFDNALWMLLSLEWWQRLYLDRPSPDRPAA